jgi:acetyl esterase/lipase
MKTSSLLLVAAARLLTAAPPEIVLRPDLPAGEEWYKPDNVKDPAVRWVRNIKRPVLEVYAAAKPNGAAMIVAPGGAFRFLAIEHEGRQVAAWLNERGITAFVLRYRVGIEPREESQKAGVEDGLLAVKTVRGRASEWKLDPKRIGFMGFSAGGWVTVGVATRYTAESRPDFAAPIYAVAPEYTVPADAPPLFVAVAWDDSERMTSTATRLLDSWKKAKVPVEMHVFPDGGHGFGMYKLNKSSDMWTDLLAGWLTRIGAITSR